MSSKTTPKQSSFQKVRSFLQKDVWDIEITALTSARRLLVRSVRVLQLVLNGFRRDECVLHASSLTFMTLLSFIPVLAIALSMARAFGDPNLLRDRAKEGLREWVLGAEEPRIEEAADVESVPAASDETASDDAEAVVLLGEGERAAMMGMLRPEEGGDPLTLERLENMIDVAFERINHLNFGALGGIGVALLLWTVISTLSQVEAAFNRVWGVTKQRTLYRKFTDYLSVVVVVPLLLTAASTIPATSLLSRLATAAGGTPTVASFTVRFVRSCGMLALVTLSLAFVLRFIPNTKVRFVPGICGGFIVAIAMTLWMRICLTFQIGLAKYSAFFGSFAVVPLLLFWVYVSWIILLVGAEFSFGLQNADTYRMEGDSRLASLRTRLKIAVDLAASAARAVQQGDGLLRMAEWNQGHRIPVRLVNDVLDLLVRRDMLVETVSGSGEYAVRFDAAKATVASVLLAMLDDGDAPEAVGVHTPATSLVGASLDEKMRESLSTRLVDLAV